MLLGEVLAFLHRYNRVVVTTAAVLAVAQVAQLIARIL
jgi:hypothetical protein